MTGDKFVVKVTIERVVREPVGLAADRRIQTPPASTERKVDTVASVVVTADSLNGAIQKAHAHLVAEGDHVEYERVEAEIRERLDRPKLPTPA